MNIRQTILLPTLTVLAVAAAPAQQRARAELFTRLDGDMVQAVVRIEIDQGYHIYHDAFSDSEFAGTVTSFRGVGDDVEWETWQMPEPAVGFEPLLEKIYEKHEGTILVHGLGLLLGGDPDEITIEVVGQTCDDKVCTPYSEKMTTRGAGSDTAFANFPLGVEDHDETPKADGSGGHEDDGGQAAEFDWSPFYSPSRLADFMPRVEHDGALALLRLEVAVSGKYHLYNGPTVEDMAPGGAIGVPTTVAIEGDGIEWGAPRFPKPSLVLGMNEEFDDIQVAIQHGNFVIEIPGRVTDAAATGNFSVTLAGQTCDENSCLDYFQTKEAPRAKVASIAKGSADAATGTEGSVVGPTGSQDSEPEPADEDKSLGSFLLEAFFWGLITLLMPCTYPMIPITISFFTKQAIARDGKVLSLALAYGAGIVFVFIAIGVVVGAPIQEFANHPVFNLLIAAMFVFFALVLFGWINLQPPQFLMRVAGQASATSGLVGVFMMGLTLVVTSFTCTAPFVGTLLARGGEQGLLRIVMGMGVFGLTMATPFVFLSLFPSRAQKMPNAGAWMNTLKVFLGFVELAASLKFLSVADLAWEWGFLSKEVFLILWAGIFMVAAMYLFGKINLKGEEDGVVSPGRMVGGLVTFLFAVYCGFLTFGFQMDPLLTAFAPPYSTAPVRSASNDSDGHTSGVAWELLTDDYEGALVKARAQDKLLLINFTGFN
ncbi:MAG TPA: hypothetical protein EYQ25_08470 [Planctomycetes bacterium]|nr:hypothetical protein [Planctomycetota bacterium]HIL37186.1 hypothetical protein [Planctomycetota bacterium]